MNALQHAFGQSIARLQHAASAAASVLLKVMLHDIVALEATPRSHQAALNYPLSAFERLKHSSLIWDHLNLRD